MAHVEPLSREEALVHSAALRDEAVRLDKQFGFIPNSIRTMASGLLWSTVSLLCSAA